MMYFGMFEKIKDLDMPNVKYYDLYESELANIYDLLGKDTNYDFEIYNKHAMLMGGEVLELACGSGRVTIELASKGHKVTGIDLSEDMMNLMKPKLSNIRPRQRKNIEVFKADMTEFELNKKFDLAILPATTICLLYDEDAVLKMMNKVHSHLREGGRFIFDYRVIENLNEGVHELSPSIVTDKDEELNKMVLIQEKIDTINLMSYVNFYGEYVSNEETKRYLGTTTKKIVTDEFVDKVIDKSKFELIETEDLALNKNERITFKILEKR